MRKIAGAGALGLMLLVTACSGDEDRAAPACELLGIEDISAVLAAPVEPGRPSGTSTSCAYVPERDEAAATTVLVSYWSGDEASRFARDKQLTEATGGEMYEITNVGDEAYSFSAADVPVHTAEARFGDRRLRISVEGAGGDRKQAETLLEVAASEVPNVLPPELP